MIIALLIVNTIALAVILYRQQKIIEMLEENAHAINDVWNYITKHPHMTIDGKSVSRNSSLEIYHED